MNKTSVLPQHTEKGDRNIRATVVFAVVLVSILCTYISYGHGYDLAIKFGESPSRAWAFPVTLDGLIYSASMVLLRASRHNVQAPAAAWCALFVGIGGTLYANIMHGVPHGVHGVLVSTWPAVSLVVSFEMLMRLFRSAQPIGHSVQDVPDVQEVEPQDVPAQVPVPVPEIERATLVVPVLDHDEERRAARRAEERAAQAQAQAHVPDVPAEAQAPVPAQEHTTKPVARVPVPRARPVHAVPDPGTPDRYTEGVQLYRDSVARGVPMNQTELAKALKMTNRKLAARIIKEENDRVNDSVPAAESAAR